MIKRENALDLQSVFRFRVEYMKDCCYGEKLIAAGTAIAFQIAQQYPPEDLAILSGLFEVIGDELGLLAETKTACQERCTLPQNQ